MKVLIFGYGNLGQSLVRFCKTNHYPCIFISRKFSEPQCTHSCFTNEYEADLVINTASGRVWDNFDLLWRLNITDNEIFLKMYSTRPYIAFSSQIAEEPWRNPYAAIKNALESLTDVYENLFIIRLRSIFGDSELDFQKVLNEKLFNYKSNDQVVRKIFEVGLQYRIQTVSY